MKVQLSKLFGLHSEGKPDAQPHLPLPLTTGSLYENQKRALIGWLANQMGQKLQLDRTRSGTLIYLSFIFNMAERVAEDEEQMLLTLASELVEWILGEEDVYLRIKDLQLTESYHRCLLECYEAVKADICRYLANEKPSETAEECEDERTWQIYRDVLYAITQRKFLLIRKSEIETYREGKVICEASIVERSDIPKARESAKQALLEFGVKSSEVMSYLLVISEAVTNILKHAEQGKLHIVNAGSRLCVLVEDKGPGFSLQLLPNAVLMAGYSTKRSLGQGFTLMLKIADLFLLSSVPRDGTTLILVFNRHDKEVGQNTGQHSTG